MRPQAHPRTRSAPLALHDDALDQLAWVKAVVTRAGAFTAVPGWGGAAMGATALGAAALAHRQTTPDAWLLVWMGELALALLLGFAGIWWKVAARGAPLDATAARRFALAFAPALVAGGAITGMLWRIGAVTTMAPVWLLSYGVAVLSGGALSVRLVPAMGAAFLALGVAAAVAAPAGADLWLAAGFGGLHLVFGVLVARRHGG